MDNITLNEIILLSAAAGIKLQQSDGSLPAGHNGPYQDEETPVRNTGHWLMIFIKAYEISKDVQYEEAAKSCLSYLMSDVARPMQATFWHRRKPEKDFTNGIIGQAWTIEALIKAYQLFQDQSILQLAIDVFNLHPYDKLRNGWKVVNVDGSIRDFDFTFNHQLWFAGIGSSLETLTDAVEIKGVKNFIDHIPANIQVYRSGVIKHLPPFYLKQSLPGKMLSAFKMLKKSASQSGYLYAKSVGYHGFNLYALAMINRHVSSGKLFKDNKIRKATQVIQTAEFKEALNASKYAYPYNPAGIELAYLFQELNNQEEQVYWLNQQINRTFDFSKGLMTKGKTFDQHTAAARLYEAIRLHDCVLKIETNN